MVYDDEARTQLATNKRRRLAINNKNLFLFKEVEKIKGKIHPLEWARQGRSLVWVELRTPTKKVNLALIDSIARCMQLSGAKRKRGSSVCKRMCLECNQKEYTGTGTTLRPIGN